MKIYLLRRHALIVEDGAFSHKIDYVTTFKEILNLETHPNRNFAELVDFACWWSFSGEGFVSEHAQET